MFKWDAISWIATGIFVIGVALGATVDNSFLLLLAGSYLLRPTLLAFGLGKNFADERQTQVQFHSGNIALIVVVVGLIIAAISESIQGRHADTFYFLISLALLSKALVGLVMNGDHRTTAVRISLFISLLYLLFVCMEGLSIGTLIEGAPGLIILAAGLIGKKIPMVGAIVLGLVAIATLYFFGILGGLTSTRVYVSLILSTPLAVAAVCFSLSAHSSDSTGQGDADAVV